MDRDEAIAELKKVQYPDYEGDMGGDPEFDHRHADEILCKLLTHLGYEDVVAEWVKVNKWYA